MIVRMAVAMRAAIQRLEATLGDRLFERTCAAKGGAVPTQLAHANKPYVEQMLLNAERAIC